MNARGRVAIVLVSLALICCGHRERGRFAAVAAEPPSAATVVASGPVTGRACFGSGAELGDDHVIDTAVRDAIARAAGSDALTNAVIVDEGNCIRVEGTAVRIGAR